LFVICWHFRDARSIDAQRYQIDTQGIRRELVLEANLPTVMAQPSQLEQVVLNLVVNARQALESTMERHAADQRAGHHGSLPRITVRTSSAAGNVRLEVEDNGPGIREEHRTRIWDPFWTTKEEGEGTGLGLAVVHGIVAGYGGTIEVETEVGVGTRFMVTLPAALPPIVAPAVPPRMQSSDTPGTPAHEGPNGGPADGRQHRAMDRRCQPEAPADAH
jgi:signal transduction histidine kinase